jgi:hypothetical protein
MNITLKDLECRIEDNTLRFISLSDTFEPDYLHIVSFFLSRDDWMTIIKNDILLQWLWRNAQIFKEERHNFFSLKITMHESDFDTFSEMIDPQHVHLGRS